MLIWPEPILVGRNERQAAGAGGGARRRALDAPTSTLPWPTPTTPSTSTPRRRSCRRSRACGPRSPPASTSTARSRSRRTSPTRSSSRALARAAGVKNGVVQDKLFLPGLRKLRTRSSTAASSDASSRSAASSATGSSKARASRRSAPRGTTAARTAAASSSTCSATGGTSSTTSSARCARSSRSARRTSRSGSTSTASAYEHGRRRGLRDLRARGRRSSCRSTPPGAPASTATTCSSSRSTAPRAARSPACASAGCSTARRRPSRSGTPTSRTRSTSATAGTRSPTATEFDNGFKVQWELFLRHVVDGRAVPLGLPRGRAGRPARRARPMRSWRERRWLDVPELSCERRGDAARRLPQADGSLRTVHARPARAPSPRPGDPSRAGSSSPPRTSSPTRWPSTSRRPAQLDWDATLAFRRHLWSYGLGVAEAMDTAQRGDGPRLAGAARADPPRRPRRRRPSAAAIACGAGTDQLAPGRRDARRRSRARTRSSARSSRASGGAGHPDGEPGARRRARRPDDYREVYGSVLGQVGSPVILHWLGDMFDPPLAGYWGSRDLDRGDGHRRLADHRRARGQGRRDQDLAARRRTRGRAAPPAARGRPAVHRRRLQLPRADPRRRAALSDALLGIFDAIAPAAAAALQALDAGDPSSLRAVLAPTVPLARHDLRGADVQLQDGHRASSPG